jgi:hypothetical protein
MPSLAPKPGQDSIVAQRDAALGLLYQDLVAAREAAESQRHGPQGAPNHRRVAATELLGCLEAYVAALLRCRLPVPPQIRDEVRLRRALSEGKTGP